VCAIWQHQHLSFGGALPLGLSAGAAGNVQAVLRFLHLFPPEFATAKTYNLALSACQTAKSLQAASKVIDIMAIRQVPCDYIHFTTLITGKIAAQLFCCPSSIASMLYSRLAKFSFLPTAEQFPANCRIHDWHPSVSWLELRQQLMTF